MILRGIFKFFIITIISEFHLVGVPQKKIKCWSFCDQQQSEIELCDVLEIILLPVSRTVLILFVDFLLIIFF